MVSPDPASSDGAVTHDAVGPSTAPSRLKCGLVGPERPSISDELLDVCKRRQHSCRSQLNSSWSDWGRGLTDDFTEQKLYLILVKLNRISHTKTAAALPKLTVCRDGSFRHSRKSISDQ